MIICFPALSWLNLHDRVDTCDGRGMFNQYVMHISCHSYFCLAFGKVLFKVVGMPFGIKSGPSYCQRAARGVVSFFRDKHDVDCEGLYDDWVIAEDDGDPWPLPRRQRCARWRRNS